MKFFMIVSSVNVSLHCSHRMHIHILIKLLLILKRTRAKTDTE